MSRPFVRVVGVALTLNACQKPPTVTHNPPAPDPDPTIAEVNAPPPNEIGPTMNPPPPPENPPPLPIGNPPAPSLPTWDSVLSGHPEGATNPPSPMLIVSRSPEACFKAWTGGMVPPPPDVMAVGGRVVDTPAMASGTQVQCPEGQPAKLIAAYDDYVAKQKKGAL